MSRDKCISSVKYLAVFKKMLPLAIIAFIWLSLLFSNVLFATALPSTIMGWQLDQNSKFGKISSKVTKKALRIDLKDLQLIIVVTAPKWKSSVYNLKKHELFMLSYKELFKLLAVLRVNQFTNNKLAVYETRLAKDVLNIDGFRTVAETIKRIDIKQKTKPTKVAEFWMAPDIRAPQKIVDIFSSLIGLNNLNGMPVKYCSYRRGESATLFDTSSIKNIPIHTADFNISAGFKNGGNVNKLIKELLGDTFSAVFDDEEKSLPKTKR